MKQIFIIISIMSLSMPLLAQESNQSESAPQPAIIDSLVQELNLTPDSLQGPILLELTRACHQHGRNDSILRHRGMQYARQALHIAEVQADSNALVQILDQLVWYYEQEDSLVDQSIQLAERRKEIVCSLGYTLQEEDKNGFRMQRLASRIKIWYDSTASIPFDSVLNLGHAFRPDYTVRMDMNQYPGNWWANLRIQNPSNRWQELMFNTGSVHEPWDTLEIYQIGPTGDYESKQTGFAFEEDEWEIPDASNNFRITVPPHSDRKIFIRFRSFTEHIPSKIRLNHINYESYLRQRVKDRHANGVFQGIVLVQLFFFLLLFWATRDRIYGYYVLYILGLGVFIMNVNYFSESSMFSEIWNIRTYLLAIWLSAFGMLTFSAAYLNLNTFLPKWRKPLRVFLIIFSSLSALLWLSIPAFFDAMVSLTSASTNDLSDPRVLLVLMISLIFFTYFLMIMTSVIFLPIWGIKIYRREYSPAKYYLLATIFLVLGLTLNLFMGLFKGMLEGLGIFEYIDQSTILEGCIALQLCLFALAVGHKRNRLEKERREALEDRLEIQRQINAATDRFVPYEFLKTLGRESILDVNLGDQVEKHVTVFFSDIRDYTSLSEQMTPQENFIFLNAYLGRVGPIIKTNQGFVNQYYGDGIMALFMGNEVVINSSSDSVKAAIEMHRELEKYNTERAKKGRDEIRIGIGLHSGQLMLGVIGDEKRMDVGVVSDTVNTAARMEGLTKHYGATTIVSAATFDQIPEELRDFNYRYLGQVQVKGKSETLSIYDIFDGDPAEVVEKKGNTLGLFRSGMEAYFNRKFKEAESIFKEILVQFPSDKAARYYLSRAILYLQEGVPEDWTGIELIHKK